MKKKLKKKWVKALRSGEFEQTTGRLHRPTPLGGDSFCCLGVLCEVSNAKVDDHPVTGERYYLSSDNSEAFTGLTEEMLTKWKIPAEQQNTLIDLNDSKKKSFAEIADYIEENL